MTIHIVYFKHFSDPEISDIKAFEKIEDADKYTLDLAFKWYNRTFTSVIELELWLNTPLESEDIPGRPTVVTTELN